MGLISCAVPKFFAHYDFDLGNLDLWPLDLHNLMLAYFGQVLNKNMYVAVQEIERG